MSQFSMQEQFGLLQGAAVYEAASVAEQPLFRPAHELVVDYFDSVSSIVTVGIQCMLEITSLWASHAQAVDHMNRAGVRTCDDVIPAGSETIVVEDPEQVLSTMMLGDLLRNVQIHGPESIRIPVVIEPPMSVGPLLVDRTFSFVRMFATDTVAYLSATGQSIPRHDGPPNTGALLAAAATHKRSLAGFPSGVWTD